jgi:hypothetical protein
MKLGMQFGGYAQVIRRDNPYTPDKGNRTYYNVRLGTLGQQFRVGVSEEQYRSVTEGDTVKVTGVVETNDKGVWLRVASLEVVKETAGGGQGEKAPAGRGA